MANEHIAAKVSLSPAQAERGAIACGDVWHVPLVGERQVLGVHGETISLAHPTNPRMTAVLISREALLAIGTKKTSSDVETVPPSGPHEPTEARERVGAARTTSEPVSVVLAGWAAPSRDAEGSKSVAPCGLCGR